MNRLSVVIPYYQKSDGHLRRSIQSVFDQRSLKDLSVQIVVVDDSSPHPASDELQNVSVPEPFELVVLNRENGGPAAARNTGLNFLDRETTNFIAFLDSDDEWRPDHIQNAVLQLNNGADFYFANSRLDEGDTFSLFGYYHKHHRNNASGFDPEVRQITSAEAVNAISEECLPHASTTVYKFKKLSDVRFDEKFRNACEDQLFFLALSSECDLITYSTQEFAVRGRGVSIFRETLSWESLDGPNRIIDELMFRRQLLNGYGFSLGKKLSIYKSAQTKTNHWLFLVLRHLKSNPETSKKALKRYLRELPQFVCCLPIALVYLPFHYLQLRSENGS